MSLALSRQVTILLVDDNEIDREAVRRAFARQKIANPIIEAQDGIEALRMLRGQAHSPRPPRPLLILLDINMPRMNGVEFLRELRGDDLLRDCIVFVLTTSSSEEDIMAVYDFNVAGYLVKNDVGNGFVKLIDLLDSFWRIVEFPMGRMT